jgi:hypothetical protein
MDFGVDQLDIKKKMKPKLGPNVVLRIRFEKSAEGTSIGTGGYALVKQSSAGAGAAGDNNDLEMITLNDDQEEQKLGGNGNIRTDETVDSQTELLNKKTE